MKFAGSVLRGLGGALGPVSAAFDVVSLMDRDKTGRDQARQLAQQYAGSGLNYDQIMDLAQTNHQLESAIGDIGVSDYGKTLAGIGLQAGDIISSGGLGALVTAPIGALAQIDLQRKKHARSQAFKQELEALQGARY